MVYLPQQEARMLSTRPELVALVRSLDGDGRRPSEILRALIAREPSSEGDRNLRVQCFSEAFEFTDGEAYPIFGWRPDGTGELRDPAIDEMLTKRMQRARVGVDSAA